VNNEGEGKKMGAERIRAIRGIGNGSEVDLIVVLECISPALPRRGKKRKERSICLQTRHE